MNTRKDRPGAGTLHLKRTEADMSLIERLRSQAVAPILILSVGYRNQLRFTAEGAMDYNESQRQRQQENRRRSRESRGSTPRTPKPAGRFTPSATSTPHPFHSYTSSLSIDKPYKAPLYKDVNAEVLDLAISIREGWTYLDHVKDRFRSDDALAVAATRHVEVLRLANRYGLSVAHIVAFYSPAAALELTKQPDVLRFADVEGTTVAHVAARWPGAAMELKKQPETLKLVDRLGRTVADDVHNTLA
jgi:hypothetical protein